MMEKKGKGIRNLFPHETTIRPRADDQEKVPDTLFQVFL